MKVTTPLKNYLPHTVVVDVYGPTNSTLDSLKHYHYYWEILGPDTNCGCTPPCWRVAKIDSQTGEVSEWDRRSVPGKHFTPLAPTHPLYLKWAAARLRDRLEGKDR